MEQFVHGAKCRCCVTAAACHTGSNRDTLFESGTDAAVDVIGLSEEVDRPIDQIVFVSGKEGNRLLIMWKSFLNFFTRNLY